MIKVKKHGVILRPTKLAFESKCVFNPGIIQEGEQVSMIYRAMDKDFSSSFGYALLDGPLKIKSRMKSPLYAPKHKYESRGIEDPRIIKIKDTYYIIYVAHDGLNAVIAYMYGHDLMRLKRGGIISPCISYRKAAKLFTYTKLKDKYLFMSSFYEKYGGKNILVWEKDGVIFPEKIRGKYILMHRILPDIQLAYFNDFSELKDNNYWHDHLQHLSKHVIMENIYEWEGRHIGGGAPPVKTKEGWLIIYHGVEPRNIGRIYYAGAALLDLKNPKKVIARLPYPFISPDQKYEQEGHVNDVVFPTGTSLFNKELYIYYGTSDSYVAVASVNIDKLTKELLKNKVKI